jgi:hypothetical protein
LEVKQSAAKQTWNPRKPVRSTFDIKPRSGRYDGDIWIQSLAPERFADIYLFAFHPGIDEATDHRDPEQWEFYVIRTGELPAKSAISLIEVRAKVRRLAIRELTQEIESARLICGNLRSAGNSPETEICDKLLD